MFVNLEKEDLVRLLMSSSPRSYEEMGAFADFGFGRHIGGFDDKWVWDREKLETLKEETLIDLYSYLRGRLIEYLEESEE